MATTNSTTGNDHLEGDIRRAITFYKDLHQCASGFDFVLANESMSFCADVDKRLTTIESH